MSETFQPEIDKYEKSKAVSDRSFQDLFWETVENARSITRAEEIAFMNKLSEGSDLDSTEINTRYPYTSIENQTQVREALRVAFGDRAGEVKVTNWLFQYIGALINKYQEWKEATAQIPTNEIESRVSTDPELQALKDSLLLKRDALMWAMITYSLDEMEAVDKEITAAHPNESYDEVSARINAVYDTFVAELIKRIPYEPVK